MFIFGGLKVCTSEDLVVYSHASHGWLKGVRGICTPDHFYNICSFVCFLFLSLLCYLPTIFSLFTSMSFRILGSNFHPSTMMDSCPGLHSFLSELSRWQKWGHRWKRRVSPQNLFDASRQLKIKNSNTISNTYFKPYLFLIINLRLSKELTRNPSSSLK